MKSKQIVYCKYYKNLKGFNSYEYLCLKAQQPLFFEKIENHGILSNVINFQFCIQKYNFKKIDNIVIGFKFC